MIDRTKGEGSQTAGLQDYSEGPHTPQDHSSTSLALWYHPVQMQDASPLQDSPTQCLLPGPTPSLGISLTSLAGSTAFTAAHCMHWLCLPGLMLKVLWMKLRRMQVAVLMTACMCEKSCMAHSGKLGAEPF